MYTFSCVLWAIFWSFSLLFKTASKKTIEFCKRPYSQLGKMRNSLKTNLLIYVLMKLVGFVGFDFF